MVRGKNFTQETYTSKQYLKDIAFLAKADEAAESLGIVGFPHNIDLGISYHRDCAVPIARDLVYSYYPKVNSLGGDALPVDLTTVNQVVAVAGNIYNSAKKRIAKFGRPGVSAKKDLELIASKDSSNGVKVNQDSLFDLIPGENGTYRHPDAP